MYYLRTDMLVLNALLFQHDECTKHKLIIRNHPITLHFMSCRGILNAILKVVRSNIIKLITQVFCILVFCLLLYLIKYVKKKLIVQLSYFARDMYEVFWLTYLLFTWYSVESLFFFKEYRFAKGIFDSSRIRFV